MERYIALLRGVNVGGKNTVSMPVLKAALTEAGFLHVRTYINSGNIFFSADEVNAADLQQKCRQVIMDRFGLDIPVAVMAEPDLADMLAHAPGWWGDGSEAKHNAIFVIAPADAGAVIEAVGEAKPEYEQIAIWGQLIFWSAPLKTFSRTRWAKVSATPAYESITIRNLNTTKKLLELSRQNGEPG